MLPHMYTCTHDTFASMTVALWLKCERLKSMTLTIHAPKHLTLSLFSLFTDGESFDIVMPAGGDHGFDNWRKLQKKCVTRIQWDEREVL